MKSYLSNTDVNLAVDLTRDSNGNEISVSTATYRVLDTSGVELQSTTDLDTSATSIKIDATLNQFSMPNIATMRREDIDEFHLGYMQGRIIELTLKLTDGNALAIDLFYALKVRDSLVVGFNSFQTLREAYMTALAVPNVVNWDSASEEARVFALVEARRRICQYRFTDIQRGQSYLRDERFLGNLWYLTPKEYQDTSAHLRKALRFAQIAEANAIIKESQVNENDTYELHKKGLISQTIGETQEVWRSIAPVRLTVSGEAMSYLGPFVSNNLRVGRS